jgi:hypothetical protein
MLNNVSIFSSSLRKYPSLEIWEYGRRDPLRWPRGTRYLQKLALTSAKSDGPSVGIVRLQTKATKLFLVF